MVVLVRGRDLGKSSQCYLLLLLFIIYYGLFSITSLNCQILFQSSGMSHQIWKFSAELVISVNVCQAGPNYDLRHFLCCGDKISFTRGNLFVPPCSRLKLMRISVLCLECSELQLRLGFNPLYGGTHVLSKQKRSSDPRMFALIAT